MSWNLLAATRSEGWLSQSFLSLLAAYRRWLSPHLGTRCTYRITCSRYATFVFSHAPPWTAVGLTARRLYHCSSSRYRLELEDLPDFDAES